MCDDVVCDPEEVAFASAKLIYESATTKSILTSDSNSGDKKNRKRSINNNTNCRKIPPHLQNHTYAKQWDKNPIDDGTCYACKMEMIQQQQLQEQASQSQSVCTPKELNLDKPCTEMPAIHDLKNLPSLKKIKIDPEVGQSGYPSLPPLQKNKSFSDSDTETEDVEEDTGQYSERVQSDLPQSSSSESNCNQVDLNQGKLYSHPPQLLTTFPSNTNN